MGPSHGPVAWGTMGRRRSTRHLVAVVVLAVVASLLSAVTPRVDFAAAVDGADFRPGDIISDAVFFNADSMGEAQLQAFLNSQVPSCAGANGWPCLKDIRTDSASRAAAGDGHCTAYQGGTGESAARIIVKVAKACRINPQVLVAMLQKEQGLVTAVSPTERQYRVAMGYACPDTAPCDTQYYGFANQVYMAAWQMRQYTNFPDRRYRIGAVSIQYHPNTACGSSTVNIVNQATANLYNYTPYQPNAAALANLGGVGDACSSYGNRNFWVYMNTWFGPTNTRDNPFGNIEVLTTSFGKFRLAGWAIDPNTTSPIDLHVYINGTGHRVTADLARPDVAAVHPQFGPAHGFDKTFDLVGGSYLVCIYGYNVGAGAHTLFGCPTVKVPTGAPTGALDAISVGVSEVTVSGWAIDPDTTAPIAVHVYVDRTGYGFVANRDRPDVARVYPAYGAPHGYAERLTVAPGRHDICVYAINTGPGNVNPLIACRTVDVPGTGLVESGRPPIGNAESVTVLDGTISIAGWALDPDTAASIPVHVYVDGVGAAYTADRERPDVARIYPLHGSKHGFAERIAAGAGAHDVCIFAINTGSGGHTLLACRAVTIPAPVERGRQPIGNLEAVQGGPGQIEIAGWALDPDTVGSIPVHVYVDGVGTAYLADEPRPDVARVYPLYGAAHGFSERVVAGTGRHDVCVFAINTAAGGHRLLGCAVAVVP